MKYCTAALVLVLAVVIQQVVATGGGKQPQTCNQGTKRKHPGSPSHNHRTPGASSSSQFDWKQEMSSWIQEYMEEFDDIHDVEYEAHIKSSVEIVKKLMVLNWMNYLTPTLTDGVRAVLPAEVKNEPNAEKVVEKLKKSIKSLGEEKATLAIALYRHADAGGESPHDEMKSCMKQYLVDLKLSEKDINEDPGLWVHDFDLLMCLQSIYLVFDQPASASSSSNTWSTKPITINGKRIQVTGIDKKYLTEKTWKFWSENGDDTNFQTELRIVTAAIVQVCNQWFVS